MDIYITDEQYEEMLNERSISPDGDNLGWIYLKHEKSQFELYCEIDTKDEKSVATYVDVNRGSDCIYADKETIKRFYEFGKRDKLTDKSNNCPNCGTPMIYHFNYCPKCGQILAWEEEE